MKRPSKQRVKNAIRRDYPHGKLRYIEAVELDSGVCVVEYEVCTKLSGFQPSGKPRRHYSRRLIVINAEDRYRDSITLESRFEK